jgi:hypothetical protein
MARRAQLGWAARPDSDEPLPALRPGGGLRKTSARTGPLLDGAARSGPSTAPPLNSSAQRSAQSSIRTSVMCVCTRNRVNRPLRGGAPLHRQSAWTAGIRADPAARRPPQPCASAAAPAAFLPLWGRAGILPPAAASAVYGMRRGSGARPSRPGEREETRELDSYATDGSRGGIPLRSLRGSISGPTGRKPTCHQLQSAIAPTQPRLSARRPKPASVTTSYATNCSKWRHHPSRAGKSPAGKWRHHQATPPRGERRAGAGCWRHHHQHLLSSAPTHPRFAARRSPLHVPSIRGAASSSAAGCVAWACRCGEAGDSDRGAVRRRARRHRAAR